MGESASTVTDLLLRIGQQRDRAAFAALFRAYAPRLKGFYLGAGADAASADELVQEVMLRVWRSAGTYDAARGTVDTWMFRIARNVRADLWHKEQRPELEPEDPALVPAAPLSPEDVAAAEQRGHRLREALAGLPAEQAEVLRRMYFGGQTLEAIAAEQTVSVGTIKSRVRLGFERLRRTLGVEEA